MITNQCGHGLTAPEKGPLGYTQNEKHWGAHLGGSKHPPRFGNPSGNGLWGTMKEVTSVRTTS